MSDIPQPDAIRGPSVANIMVVEDDAATGAFVVDLLTAARYQLRLYTTSAHALAALHAAPPNLILLDIWLEQADSGWDLLQALRQPPAMHAIPVIVWTAHAFLLRTMAELRHAPHYAFVAKPCTADVLLDQIHRLLHPTSTDDHRAVGQAAPGQ